MAARKPKTALVDTDPIPGIPIDPNEPQPDPTDAALIVNCGPAAGDPVVTTLGDHASVVASLTDQNQQWTDQQQADWQRQQDEDDAARRTAHDEAQKQAVQARALQQQVQQAVDAGTINPGLVAALKLLNVVR